MLLLSLEIVTDLVEITRTVVQHAIFFVAGCV